jgi:hypothetical protein
MGAIFACGVSGARAQTASEALPNAPQPTVSVMGLPRAILHDQRAIITSPAHLKRSDLRWLVPLAAATSVSLATDHTAMQQVVSRDTTFNQHNIDISNGMVGGMIALPAVLFSYGHLEKDEHAREAGLLGAEAGFDSVIVGEVLKLASFRERPMDDNGRGLFWQRSAGANSSFPSMHAITAWSVAAATAGEYHSRWAQAGVYTMATGVSLTRVLGQQHFPTDVLVGSAAGWLIGHYVVHRHHHDVDVR